MAVQRLLVVVNPRGGTGRGLAVLEQVTPTFAAAGIELDIRVTQHPGHAREIARTLDLTGIDGLCAIGGDGTIHEVADGLMQRGEPIAVPLGIIPAGTGNTLAQHLQCDDPLEAARRIVVGVTQPLDAVRVTLSNEVVFCVDVVGWGAVSDINATAERLRWLGPSRYGAAALWQILRAKRRRATLNLDGQAIDDEFLFVMACNPKLTGSGMKLAPHAEIGDGKLDVVVVRRASRWQMLKLFSKVFDGSHVALDFVEYHQVRSFAIASHSFDGTMKVWDATRVQETLTLEGHTNVVTRVAISPDGKRLASGSSDQTVKLWDVTSGQETFTLKGHTAAVTSVVIRIICGTTASVLP